jgi:hypothetical protein
MLIFLERDGLNVQKVLEHIKREFKMMRVVIIGLMFFSLPALANIVGQ